RVSFRSLNKCNSCGDTWYPRGRDLSRRCPSCGSGNVVYAPFLFDFSGTGGSGCASVFGAVFLMVGLAWCASSVCGSSSASSSSSARTSSYSPHPSSAPAVLKESGTVTLTRECPIWALDTERRPIILRRGQAGETFPILARNDETTGVRADGSAAW